MRTATILAALMMISSHAIADDVTKVEIVIENPGDSQNASDIAISLHDLGLDDIRSAHVIDKGADIPYQLDDLDGDGKYDELFFQAGMSRKEKKTVIAILSSQPQTVFFEKKVHAQLRMNDKSQKFPNVLSISVPGSTPVKQTYSMMYHHGVAFESEINGYRLYFDNRQSVDLYGKVSRQLELATTNFYSKNFVNKGYGCDVLWAGKSVGLGSFRGWDGDNPTYVDSVKVRSQSILANGPLRTVVEIKDKEWHYMGKDITMTQRYTQSASHRDVRVDISFDADTDGLLFSTGVQKMESDNTGYVRPDGLCASWGSNLAEKSDTVSFPREWLGLGAYVPKKYIIKAIDHEDNYLYVIGCKGSLTYYFTFTARKEKDGFHDMDTWSRHLDRWKKEKDNPLRITARIAK